jgi:hypothetical protein
MADWERAFYCSHECYKGDWEKHKDRHGPSKFGPSKMDSRIHEFDCNDPPPINPSP